MPRNPSRVLRPALALALVAVLLPLSPVSGRASALASELTGLRVNPGSVFEGGSTTMILRSSTTSSTPTDLNVRRIDGTATPGVDFADVDVTVTMPANSSQVTVGTLSSFEDDLPEDLEEFIVLGIFDPAVPDTPLATSTISVIDDEPKFAFTRPADQVGSDRLTIVVEEPVTGTIDVALPIESRSGTFPYRGFLSVFFRVDPIGSNSASLGDDLTVLPAQWDGPDSFGGSQEPPNLILRIAADDLDEGSERILLGLSHEAGWDGPAYFGIDDLIDITIVDPTVDPVEPVVLTTQARDEVIVEGDDTTVTVRLQSPADGSAEVRIVTVDGSANATTGSDYKPVDTTVTLDSTTRSVDVPIDTGGDVIREDQFEDLAVHVFHLDSGEPDAATEPVAIERLLIEDDEPQARFERDVFEFAEPPIGRRLVEIPVSALYGDWPFGSPLPSDDPEFDPTLGTFVDLRAEFVNPGAASLDAEWVQDTVRLSKGTEPQPFLLDIAADTDTDIERLDIRLLRSPRLGGLVPGPFLDDTATIVIGPQDDNVVDPADELRDALASIEVSFSNWTPPELDLGLFDLDGVEAIELPVLGDPGEVFDLAAEMIDVSFQGFDPDADDLDAALDDFEAKGCSTDFVADGVGGRKAAEGDDVVQIRCTTLLSDLAPTAVDAFDDSVTEAFEQFVADPELDGELDVSGDVEATVVVGIDADGVYVGGDSSISLLLAATGTITATSPTDPSSTATGAISIGAEDGDEPVGIGLVLDRQRRTAPAERIRLAELDDRVAAGVGVTIDGEVDVSIGVATGPLELDATYTATIATDRDRPRIVDDRFEANGEATFEIPDGTGDTTVLVVTVSGVVDDGVLLLRGGLDAPGAELFGITVQTVNVTTELAPGRKFDLRVDFDLAIDASGWGADAPIIARVRTQLLDGEFRGTGEVGGDRLELGAVELTDWDVNATIDTTAAPGERFGIEIAAASLTVVVDDRQLISATGITGSADPTGVSLTLETGEIGDDAWPFSLDVSGLALNTPDADGVVLRADSVSATVSGFGEEITATVSDLVVDDEFRVGVSSLVLDRGDLEQSSSVFGVVPIQLQSVEFEFERDGDGFIPDLGRFTLTTTATVATDAFDGWPFQPVITLGAATIGPDTPADERQVSITARVVSVDPLRIEPVDLGPVGIGIDGFEIGTLTVDANVVAEGYVGGELQPGISGSITVDTGADVITQAGADVTGRFEFDDATGTPIGLTLDTQLTVDLDLTAAGFGVVVDDLALSVSTAFGSATGDDEPAAITATGIEAAKVDFALGDFFDASATDVVFDLDNLFDGSGVLLSIGGDLDTDGSGAVIRVAEQFGGFAGWGGTVGNVGVTATGQLIALDGFFIGVLTPGSDETTSFGLPDWLPIQVNEVIAGFGTPPTDLVDPFDIVGAGPLAVAQLGAVEADHGFAPIDLPLGTAVDATLIGQMKLQVSAELGGGDVPISAEVDDLRIDIGKLLEFDFTAPFSAEDLPIENLDSVSVTVEPIDLGGVEVGGRLGFGSVDVDTPDGPAEALYLQVSGALESAAVNAGAAMVISEVGPVLLRVTTPAGVPIGPTGFVLNDVTGAVTFGDVLLETPDLGDPLSLLDGLDGSLPTDVALDDASIAAAVEPALAAGVFTWDLGGALALSGRLTHVGATGLAEGDVTVAVAIGPARAGGLAPGAQVIGRGDISLMGIDLFGLIDGGEVAEAGIMFDLSSPGDPRVDVAFRSPTEGSPLALLFPASLTIGAQLDLEGVFDATVAGVREIASTVPDIGDALLDFTARNPDSALGRAFAAVPSGTPVERLQALLATDPEVVVAGVLPALAATRGDLVDVFAAIRDGARRAILAVDTSFDPSLTFTAKLQPQLLGLPIGDPALDITTIINKDAIAFDFSGSLIESVKQATQPFAGQLPTLLFQLATLDMSDRADLAVQIPLPQMQQLLLAGGDLPPVDLDGGQRFTIGIGGSLRIAGTTMQVEGFYTAADNRAVLDTLVQKRFELPADTPVDPGRIPIVDGADYDRLVAVGGFVLAGRLLVPRVVTDPVGVIEDIGSFPSTPLAIAEWFDDAGDAVTGLDDPISATLVIPSPPDLLTTPTVPGAFGAVRDWVQTITFTGVFDGTARVEDGPRTTRLLSVPIGTGLVRASGRGIEVSADVPLAGADATFVLANVERPTGGTDRNGVPVLEERWGAAVDVSVSSDAAIRNALTEIGLPADWAPDRVGGDFELVAATPGFDLSSSDPLRRRGGVRATAGLQLGGIVDSATATIEILPGGRPGVASFVDPDFALQVTSDTIDLAVVELADIDVTLSKTGTAYAGRVAADVEFALPNIETPSFAIDQSFAGTADLSFGIDREIDFIGQSLDVELDVDIVDRAVSIDGSASGQLTIGGVELLSGGFDVSLSDGELRLTIPDDEPLTGNVYNVLGFEVTGFVTNTNDYALDASFTTNGATLFGLIPVAWNGEADVTVTRRPNGSPLVNGSFTGAVSAAGVRAELTALIVNRSDGRGEVIGSVSGQVDGTGIQTTQPFSFIIGVPSPPDIEPPTFGDVDDVVVALSGGAAANPSVPVTFVPPVATDDRDGSIVSTCDPAPGDSVGTLGGTVTVTCDAVDTAGNSSSATFQIRFESAGEITAASPGGVNDEIEVQGSGFTPLISAIAVFFSDPIRLGEFPVAADGTLTARVEIPDVDPGLHHLVLFGVDSDGGPRSIVIPAIIGPDGALTAFDGRPIAELLPAPTPTPVGGLPTTGGTVSMLLLTALALVSIGVMILRSGRRRVGVR